MSDDFESSRRYTRKQAIEDGFLVDVTDTAKEAGIRFPTALTREVWDTYVKVPQGVECQDEAGRLWDIVWMMRWGIHSSNPCCTTIRFELLVRNDNRKPKQITLKVVCGPDDDGKPCLTVMLPEED